jgi:hypothetical protein
LIRAEENGKERKGGRRKETKSKKGRKNNKRNAQEMKGNERRAAPCSNQPLWQKEATGQQANP